MKILYLLNIQKILLYNNEELTLFVVWRYMYKQLNCFYLQVIDYSAQVDQSFRLC